MLGLNFMDRVQLYQARYWEKPIEKRIFRKGLDNTWKEDFREFEKNVNLNKNSLQNDLKLSKALAHIVLTAPNTKDPQRNFYRQILK